MGGAIREVVEGLLGHLNRPFGGLILKVQLREDGVGVFRGALLLLDVPLQDRDDVVHGLGHVSLFLEPGGPEARERLIEDGTRRVRLDGPGGPKEGRCSFKLLLRLGALRCVEGIGPLLVFLNVGQLALLLDGAALARVKLDGLLLGRAGPLKQLLVLLGRHRAVGHLA